MNYNELYVLNSAIDGEDIYSIPKFSSNRQTKAAVELIKDMLIEKEYLEDYSTLATKGVQVIDKIKLYKNAEKYVSILNLVIGFVDEKKGILLTVDRKGEYQFSTIDLRKNLEVLTEAFPELLQCSDKIDTLTITDTYVNPRDLLNEYKINVRTSFTINTEHQKNKEKNTKELFFKSKGKKYYYDCMSNHLKESGSNDIILILQKRLEVV